MVDFNLSKEEDLWRWAVKDFADRELATKDIIQFDDSMKKIVGKMGKLGFMGVTFPEEYGGDPASWVMYGLLIEEIARVHSGVAYFLAVSHQVGYSLNSFASKELKKEWLPGLIEGKAIGCIASTEPDVGSDFNALKTEMELDDDDYLVSGVKEPVSFGSIADFALTYAHNKSEDPTAIIVPLKLDGIKKTVEPMIGLKLATPATLAFDNVKVPKHYQIGKEGEGLRINLTSGIFSSVNQVASALISLGMAQTALSQAIQYAKERYVFDKPLSKYQEISQKIAENATLLEAGRWSCYRALSLMDSKKAYAKEAAMCGWWCPKISYQAIQDTILIHGHYGYSDDYPFEQMLKDVVAFELISGTEPLLKQTISAQLMGAAGVPDCLTDRVSGLSYKEV